MKGYTQEELAKAVHVSVTVIGGVERGTKEPPYELLQDIAELLDIHIHELTGEERNER
jgi:transcriptional regulator with XRE-family HTH domain